MKTKSLAAVFFIILVVIPIFFVSLLGENNRIDDLVDNYFSKLQVEDFSGECPPISINQTANKIDEGVICSNKNFVFIISLLQLFDLLNTADYSVNIKRDSFWIPFISEDTITVSVNLVATENDEEINYFDDIKYLPGLFVVQRKDLRWEIKNISLNSPELISLFNSFKNTLDFEKYIKKTDTGYEFNNVVINKNNVTVLDRLLLKLNIQKINNILE
jgi:hypothetical protein